MFMGPEEIKGVSSLLAILIVPINTRKLIFQTLLQSQLDGIILFLSTVFYFI